MAYRGLVLLAISAFVSLGGNPALAFMPAGAIDLLAPVAPVPAERPEAVMRAQEAAIAAAEGKKTAVKTPALAYAPAVSSGNSSIDKLIDKYAMLHGIPSSLIHSVVKRESTYNPNARNRAYWGLMQISYATAKGMGYKGSPSGLLDPETNLKYAVKYLAGAYLVAGGDAKRADRLYRSGYYYQAKRKGLLEETGLR